MAARFGHVTIDTTDVARAGVFWAAVLGGMVLDPPGGEFAIVQADGQPDLMLQRVERAPEVRNPVHLDLFTDDLDPETERLIGLGARLVERHEGFGTRWCTLADPDGWLFDLVLVTP